jgi:diadenosine tetraphosphate (Ap4A) HIT family hydrolase
MIFLKKMLYSLATALCSSYSLATTAMVPAIHKTLNTMPLPEQILYEDKQAYVLRNTASLLSTSLLIFPKKELAGIHELDFDKRSNRELLAHLLWVAQHLGNLMFGAQGYRITINHEQDCSERLILCLQLDAQ